MSNWDIGENVAGYFYKANSPRAQLLLQHGYGEYAERYIEQYSQLIPKLVANGIDVYAIDLPGHGNTTGERGQVDLTEAVRLHLMARKALPAGLPTVLFGHSLGGLVTAGSITRDRANVVAVILSSSAMQAPSKRWERVLGKISAALAPSAPMPLPRPGMEALTRDLVLLEKIKGDPKMYQGKPKNLVAKTVLEISDEVWTKVADWKVPSLIFHGNKDTSTNHLNSMALHEKIASPDRKLLIYPGGFHELLNDLDHEEVEKDLFAWLLARV
jgi:alpha-beta hydrolase superfamily lysophospholipase